MKKFVFLSVMLAIMGICALSAETLLFNQPYDINSPSLYTSTHDATFPIDYKVADNFGGIAEPITKVTFYGVFTIYGGGLWTPSTPAAAESFNIYFYNFVDTATEPVWATPAAAFTVTATTTYIGTLTWGGYSFYKFEALLPASVNMSSGWVSAQYNGPAPDGAWFLWMESTVGEDVSYQYAGAKSNSDMAGITAPNDQLTLATDATRAVVTADMALELYGGTLLPGYMYTVTSHDVMNPSGPDLNAEILYSADPDGVPVSFYPQIFTPYVFGQTGNHAFVEGRYAVQKQCWSYWIPESVSFIAITSDYTSDFLGIWICDNTPVELSGFSATLTAQKYVQLSWVSQTETNMMGYRVYRNETNDQSTSMMITPTLVPATNTSEAQTYTVTDNEVTLGQTYFYWLESVDVVSSQFYGPLSIIVEGEVPPVVPEVSSMKSAYPNPFRANSSTSIEVALKGGETGTVTVYNLAGQAVRTFRVNEGTHNITWNGMDSNGAACSSGIYFYKLSTPSINQTRKMVIIK